MAGPRPQTGMGLSLACPNRHRLSVTGPEELLPELTTFSKAKNRLTIKGWEGRLPLGAAGYQGAEVLPGKARDLGIPPVKRPKKEIAVSAPCICRCHSGGKASIPQPRRIAPITRG